MIMAKTETPSAKKRKNQPNTAAWAAVAASSGQTMAVYGSQIEAVMAAAQRSGLLHDKVGRIGGRISPTLVEKAKARTGIATDTDLIEFALANIALEDRFAESFDVVRGTVDPELNLGF